MRKDLLNYWRNPNDGYNNPERYLEPKGWLQSFRLFELLRELIPPESNPNILELGCNVGRNLILLRFGGYRSLTGIELNENAVMLMRRTFQDANSINIQIGELEKLIYDLRTETFDIVFTTAVLQHLPPESEHVFKEIVRVMKGYLVTIEDERQESWRHFPRRYDRIFSKLGLKQVKVVKNLDGFSSSTKTFVCRIFKKECHHGAKPPLSTGIMMVPPKEGDTKPIRVRVEVSSNKTFEEAHQDAVDKLKKEIEK